MYRKTILGFAAAAALAVAGSASASLVYDANISTGWNPPGNNGQVNGHFVVENQLGSTPIELGLRAQQRRIGPITADAAGQSYYYTVKTGEDPGTNGNRAWWNFDWSATYGTAIGDLDSLVLRVFDVGGTQLNSVDLLAFATATSIDISTTATIQESWNPLFSGVGVPGFSVNTTNFAYWFTMTASDNGAVSSSLMCVHTDGDSCGVPPPLPEPASLAIVGLGLAALAVTRRRKLD